MTDSHAEARSARARTQARVGAKPRFAAKLALLPLLTALAALASACSSPAPPPPARPLEPLPTLAGREPDRVDHTAARLAEEALAIRFGQQTDALAEQVATLRSLARHPELAEGGPLPDEPRLLRTAQIAVDLANTTVDDPVRYRALTDDFVRETILDPTLERRLQQDVADDPRKLAIARRNDGFEIWFADAFNAVSQPVGQSLVTGFILAPFQLSYSVTHYLARQWERERFGVPQRQAHALRKEYVSRYPESVDAPSMSTRIAKDDARLSKQQRDRLLAQAEHALEIGEPRLARIQSERALIWMPEDPEAAALLSRAHTARETRFALAQQSLDATPGALPDVAMQSSASRAGAAFSTRGEDLAIALFDEDGDAWREATLVARDPQLADEAAFVLATLQQERGFERGSWKRIDAIARGDGNMARHARALERQPLQNLYGAFETQRRVQSRKRLGWRVFGNFSQRPRYQKIPTPVSYLIDLPLIVQTLVLAPFRAVLAPAESSTPDFHRGTAIAAYRYLDRHPDGEHRREVMAWLYGYQRGRERWDAALRVADFLGDIDPEERAELVEKAGELRLAAAERARRRDRRGSLYKTVASEFPDSEAAQQAGDRAREAYRDFSPQHIRVSRQFLRENPAVAGPRGLGLRGELRDGEIDNGELHPQGVTLLGGEWIRLAFVAASGDEDDEPLELEQEISSERLARLVSLLEETTLRNAKLDVDDQQAADSRRDHFFERARLGLTEDVDARATAESSYAYLGVRERYGMVRGRESALPFDLVVRGSVQDLSLGAFPRWRVPEQTPDAFLYR